jgi:ribosomal-protein-serine acetyltransferase
MEELTLTVAPELALVSARPTHAPAQLALIQRNHGHIQRYHPKVTEIDTLQKAEAHVVHCLEKRRARELFEFHVFNCDELCGIVRLNYFDWENRKAAIAYLLDQAHGGRGIATQAARAMLGFAFHELGLHRVELRCAVSNTASRRVAERLGFTREGELREVEWADGAVENEFVYGLLGREFEATGPNR